MQLPVALAKHHDVFHVSLLKPYVRGGDGIEAPQPIEVDGESEWEVECIVKHRTHRGKRQYLVKYLGYDMSEAMWLEEADLSNSPDLLRAYKGQHNLP